MDLGALQGTADFVVEAASAGLSVFVSLPKCYGLC